MITVLREQRDKFDYVCDDVCASGISRMRTQAASECSWTEIRDTSMTIQRVSLVEKLFDELLKNKALCI